MFPCANMPGNVLNAKPAHFAERVKMTISCCFVTIAIGVTTCIALSHLSKRLQKDHGAASFVLKPFTPKSKFRITAVYDFTFAVLEILLSFLLSLVSLLFCQMHYYQSRLIDLDLLLRKDNPKIVHVRGWNTLLMSFFSTF